MIQGCVVEEMRRLAGREEGSEIAVGVVALGDLSAIRQRLPRYPAGEVIVVAEGAIERIGHGVQVALARAALIIASVNVVSSPAGM